MKGKIQLKPKKSFWDMLGAYSEFGTPEEVKKNLINLGMKRMKSLEKLKVDLEAIKPMLKERYKVKTIGIFGSYIRGEQTKKSDLDLLVSFSEPIGIYKFIEVEEFITNKLRVKVDLVQKGALLSMIKDQVLNETILI